MFFTNIMVIFMKSQTNTDILGKLWYILTMKQKKLLQKFLNTQLKPTIESYFGEKSKINVNNMFYVRKNDSYAIDVTLYTDNLDKLEDLYPDGVNLCVQMAWKVVGLNKSIIIKSSFDLID